MKKVFLALVLALVSLAFVSRGAFAGAYPWEPGFDIDQKYNEALDPAGGPNMVKWFEEGLFWISKSVAVAFSGSADPNTGQPVQTGLVGIAGAGVLTVLVNPPPVSGVNYLASLNPFKPAYASTGTETLEIVRGLWEVLRNLAYVLVTVVLVVAGFMVLFGAKVDPRTTVTLQLVLPKVVLGLIFITLSYAISGLIIDLYSLLQNFLEGLLTGQAAAALDAAFQAAGKTRDLVGDKFPERYTILEVWGKFGAEELFNVFGKSGEIQLPGLGGIISALGINFFQVAVGFALFQAIIKTLFKLIQYYAIFFVFTVISPIVFLIGILPGGESVVSGWAKKMVAAALVFPTLYLAINLALYLKIYVERLSSPAVPAIVGAFTGEYANEQQIGGRIIFYGILLALPMIPDLIENIFAGKAEGGRDAVDLGSGLKRVPIIGGFVG